jgi:hypothetical protein
MYAYSEKENEEAGMAGKKRLPSAPQTGLQTSSPLLRNVTLPRVKYTVLVIS